MSSDSSFADANTIKVDSSHPFFEIVLKLAGAPGQGYYPGFPPRNKTYNLSIDKFEGMTSDGLLKLTSLAMSDIFQLNSDLEEEIVPMETAKELEAAEKTEVPRQEISNRLHSLIESTELGMFADCIADKLYIHKIILNLLVDQRGLGFTEVSQVQGWFTDTNKPVRTTPDRLKLIKFLLFVKASCKDADDVRSLVEDDDKELLTLAKPLPSWASSSLAGKSNFTLLNINNLLFFCLFDTDTTRTNFECRVQGFSVSVDNAFKTYKKTFLSDAEAKNTATDRLLSTLSGIFWALIDYRETLLGTGQKSDQLFKDLTIQADCNEQQLDTLPKSFSVLGVDESPADPIRHHTNKEITASIRRVCNLSLLVLSGYFVHAQQQNKK